MKSEKFYYDPDKLEFKEAKHTFKSKFYSVLGFVCAVLFTSVILIFFAWKYLESPREKISKLSYNQLSEEYQFITKKYDKLDTRMRELEKRDNEIYRVIFEAPPVNDSVRRSYTEIESYFHHSDNVILESIEKKIKRLESRMTFEQDSYDYLSNLISKKSKLLSSTPAIQPIHNKDLSRISSTFGVRMDPIYKVNKFHYGIDFSAPSGTPIHATADGVIQFVGRKNGYGKCVIINHGYGYKTLYAHMSRFKSKVRQRIKRGNVIGYVGNTGKSVAPHLHYEVIKNGKKINPINFFFGDIDPEQYEQVVKLGESVNQSLD